MKRNWNPLLSFPATLVAGLLSGRIPIERLAAQESAGQETTENPAGSEPATLERLPPGEEPADSNDLGDLFTRDLDRDRWRERLTDSDLERRERSLDALEKRAGFDPLVRAYLEELARDPEGGELAWTARLALRQLRRAHLPIPALPGADPFATAPLRAGPLGAMQRMQQMQELMNELLAQGGLPPMRQALTRSPGSERRTVELEQGPAGARVRIFRSSGAQEGPREYEGSSLDDVLARYPELASELGGIRIRVRPGASLDLSLELGGGMRAGSPATERGWFPEPQGRSRPILTDRLGVVVHPLEAERAKALSLAEPGPGLVVERTVPDTFAHLLGVEPGDVLLELDRTPLHTGEDIERAMGLRRADQELRLVWLDALGQRQERTWRPPASGTQGDEER